MDFHQRRMKGAPAQKKTGVQGQRRSDIELGPEVAFVRQAHIDRLVGRGHMIGCVRGGR
jgi:hypothetical protein